jgi:hypothetical protein
MVRDCEKTRWMGPSRYSGKNQQIQHNVKEKYLIHFRPIFPTFLPLSAEMATIFFLREYAIYF